MIQVITIIFRFKFVLISQDRVYTITCVGHTWLMRDHLLVSTEKYIVILFEFQFLKLIHDDIKYHIGDQFIISASQYLYAYRWYAIS